ncbi:MAG: energy-coupling factor ABC transporter permease [Anaerovorax sp.]|nr:energy-coupling factor ABC transporter permease [Anaerovorax sp.]
MHMADALISPIVGGTMLAASTGVAAYSIKKVQKDLDEKKVPFMGVMGAFVFSAQMINFSIPATGSSGHLGGGMLLAIMLGPYAGFLSMASILLIQALFFGDGGLLAYGCNVWNLGFYTCFLAYPLFLWVTKKGFSSKRIFWGAMVSSLIALQLGAFSVVLETLFSGKTELPFGVFVLLMQPIHLAIGVVEGLVTALITTFVWKARPEVLEQTVSGDPIGSLSIKRILMVILVAAVLVGGSLSWFASENPDGLEWSMEKTSGSTELETEGEIYQVFSRIQDKIVIMPDYGFSSINELDTKSKGIISNERIGTSVSGILGGFLTLILIISIGFSIHIFKKKKRIGLKK